MTARFTVLQSASSAPSIEDTDMRIKINSENMLPLRKDGSIFVPIARNTGRSTKSSSEPKPESNMRGIEMSGFNMDEIIAKRML